MAIHTLFIGTYTQKEDHVEGKAEGLYVYVLDTEKEKLKHHYTADGIVNPSFCALSPDKTRLYTVSETNTFSCTGLFPGDKRTEKSSGGLCAYQFDAASRKLDRLNTVPSEGTFPCHVSTDPYGNYVYCANYMSGSLAMFPVKKDGSLATASSFIQHSGKSVNPIRQEGPHTHSVNHDMRREHLIVPDLGTDTIAVYRVDRKKGSLESTDKNIHMNPGSGPRHFTFHPGGEFGYGINELSSTVTVFSYKDADCTLEPIQEVSTLPPGFSKESTCAELRIHPQGNFLYASNRGHDSIAVFTIDKSSGTLELLHTESTRGKTPRHFTIDPGGECLLAANQDSDTVVLFAINRDTGDLVFRSSFDVPTPVCLLFY